MEGAGEPKGLGTMGSFQGTQKSGEAALAPDPPGTGAWHGAVLHPQQGERDGKTCFPGALGVNLTPGSSDLGTAALGDAVLVLAETPGTREGCSLGLSDTILDPNKEQDVVSHQHSLLDPLYLTTQHKSKWKSSFHSAS